LDFIIYKLPWGPTSPIVPLTPGGPVAPLVPVTPENPWGPISPGSPFCVVRIKYYMNSHSKSMLYVAIVTMFT